VNVLQVSKWYLPYKGGIETVVQQIVDGLKTTSERNFRVLACNHEASIAHQSDHVGGVPVERVPAVGVLFSTPIAPTFPAAYTRGVQRADVVHVHSPFPLVELFDPWLRYDARLVVTLHSVPTQTKWTMLDPLYQAALSRFVESAHRVVTTSEAMINAVPFLRRNRERCEVIPPAADVQKRAVSEKEQMHLREEIQAVDEEVLLFVGRLVYYKGVDILLRAMANVEDAILVVVGKGPEREALQELASNLGIDDQVRFPGFVSGDDLPVYYSTADLFVLPSISSSEAFGIVQVEAMMYGVPVVNTSLDTGVASVSRDGETGLTVPPGDVEALTEAIQTLLSDPELRADFSAAARKRAQDFEKDHVVGQYAELYDEISREPLLR
jgi:glycosyltransferase involved in cell wall biosynthesis